jgi:hypothetical protein
MRTAQAILNCLPRTSLNDGKTLFNIPLPVAHLGKLGRMEIGVNGFEPCHFRRECLGSRPGAANPQTGADSLAWDWPLATPSAVAAACRSLCNLSQRARRTQ